MLPTRRLSWPVSDALRPDAACANWSLVLDSACNRWCQENRGNLQRVGCEPTKQPFLRSGSTRPGCVTWTAKTATSRTWARIEMEDAIRAWKQGDCNEAYNALGRGLHSVQDKYAHGNWNNEDWPYWWHALGGPKDNWKARPEIQGTVVKESIAYLKQFLNAIK